MSTERTYSSSLRDERARQTRLRIRKAAAELFVSDGFADTTIAAIAKRAGVSAPTVYAVFGGKAGIVVAMLEELEQNADRDVWVGKLMVAADPYEQVRIFATWIRTLYEGGAAIIRAAIAARSNPEVAAFADRGDAARREGTMTLTGMWDAAGALRLGRSADEVAEEFWMLTSVEQYLFAIDRLGWTSDQYESWLADLLPRQLLAPPPA